MFELTFIELNEFHIHNIVSAKIVYLYLLLSYRKELTGAIRELKFGRLF